MQTVEEIMGEMAVDISVDIYGDIFGHEWWAEEIFRLRAELTQLKQTVGSANDLYEENLRLRAELTQMKKQ
jgi:cell shape-determining protein MreC